MLKILDLFEGGKEGIHTRMADAIEDGLRKKVSEIKTALEPRKVDNKQAVEAIAQKLGVDAVILTQIFDGNSNGEVDYKLFSRMEIPLKLSIHRVLGKPIELDKPEVKKELDEEMKTHPMLRAAAILTHDRKDESNVTPNELELYVILRAIREL